MAHWGPFGRTTLVSGAFVVAASLYLHSSSYADDKSADSCPKRPYYYAVPNVGCVFSRTDVKGAHWQNSTRTVIDVEPGRNAKGPILFFARSQLGLDRPTATWLGELKSQLSVTTETAYGPLTISFGGKAQFVTPPLKPNDPNNVFNRTGERVVLERAGVEFLGFAMGIMPSYFDFTPSLSFTTLYASEASVPLVAYTYKFGTTDLTVSAENGSYRELTDPLWGNYASSGHADLVGAIKKRFDWGNIKFAAALHPVRAVQSDSCCTQTSGEALGWAALGGVETWFDFGRYSTEFLANVGAATGGLSYLGVTDYPADFAIMNNGTPFLSSAQAAVISGALWWTKEYRSVVTWSGYKTDLATPTFRLNTRAMQAQVAFEYYPSIVPHRGLLFGVEVSYHDEHVDGSSAGIPGAPVGNRYVTTLIYTRLRL